MAKNTLTSACEVEGCNHGVVAKGLCAKHYMRARRTGDSSKTRRAGRPRDEMLSHWRKLFPEWSPRTLARWVRARKLLRAFASDEQVDAIIKRASRPNSKTLNVSEVGEVADSIAAMVLARREP
jgi:hypothetical protein